MILGPVSWLCLMSSWRYFTTVFASPAWMLGWRRSSVQTSIVSATRRIAVNAAFGPTASSSASSMS